MRWSLKTLQKVFNRLLELTHTSRADFLEDECKRDDLFRRRMESLVRHHEEAGGVLDDMALNGVSPSDETALLDGMTIGQYRIERAIGRGGMSVVYLAHQEHPSRQVAFKTLQRSTDQEHVKRLMREATALGRQRHINVAQVYDAHMDPVPYIVMEYIAGAQSITEFCEDRHLTVRRRLELFSQACNGVHHAHQQHVIHRDLKPSNILIDATSDAPVAKVIDFGIARLADQGESDLTVLTNPDGIVGTFQYMAPEQLERKRGEIDERCDVYALGLILYELMCGCRPFEAGNMSMQEVANAVCEDEPVSPRAASARVSRALDSVIMKAIEKKPGRRYQSAADFRADLERLLNDEPVAAGSPGTAYKVSRFVYRRRVGLGRSIAAAALVCTSALAVYFWRESFGNDSDTREVGSLVADVLVRHEGREYIIAKRDAHFGHSELSIETEDMRALYKIEFDGQLQDVLADVQSKGLFGLVISNRLKQYRRAFFDYMKLGRNFEVNPRIVCAMYPDGWSESERHMRAPLVRSDEPLAKFRWILVRGPDWERELNSEWHIRISDIEPAENPECTLSLTLEYHNPGAEVKLEFMADVSAEGGIVEEFQDEQGNTVAEMTPFVEPVFETLDAKALSEAARMYDSIEVKKRFSDQKCEKMLADSMIDEKTREYVEELLGHGSVNAAGMLEEAWRIIDGEEQADYPGALKWAKRANAVLGDEIAPVLTALGVALYLNEDYAGAIGTLERADELMSNNVIICAYCALAHHALKQFNEACDWMSQMHEAIATDHDRFEEDAQWKRAHEKATRLIKCRGN